MRIVIALGGNALLEKGKEGKAEEQIEAAKKTIRLLKGAIEKNDVVITHGNGPQVGNLLIQQNATNEVPSMPLHILVAMTQGQIGFFIEYAVARLTKKRSTTIITHCEVNEKDQAFRNPSKPIGPFYKTPKPGMIEDAGRGYRIVVASPKVKRILEADMIKRLIGQGRVVVAGGGGGIPISTKGKGLQAVIDKDDLSQVLANQINAEVLLFITAVDFVYMNFGNPNQKRIEKITARELKKWINEFGTGSMKPKIEAAVKFIENGGKKVIITSIENVKDALKGKTGTIITR